MVHSWQMRFRNHVSNAAAHFPRRNAKIGQWVSGLAATLGVIVVCLVLFSVERTRSTRRAQSSDIALGDPYGSIWNVLVPQEVGDASESTLRIMFVGDSITDGSAAGTHHPRFHPNGSCSYRFSFLSSIRKHFAEQHPTVSLKTVGPFASNCGSDKVPDKCFTSPVQLPREADGSFSRWTRHAATSGVTAKGLLERETWPKRVQGYAKAGLMYPPSVEPMASEYEGRYAALYSAGRGEEQPNTVKNISDLAVWASVYQPQLVLVLLGTNDLRWGTPWASVAEVYLPMVAAELLTFSSPTSPLRDNTSTKGINQPMAALPITCQTFVVVSTLYPRDAFIEEVKAFNDALRSQASSRRRRRSPYFCSGYTRDGSKESLKKMFLCDPCVRLVDGGALKTPLLLPSPPSASPLSQEEFIQRFTFDGLHPNDIGDWNLGAHLANEVLLL